MNKRLFWILAVHTLLAVCASSAKLPGPPSTVLARALSPRTVLVTWKPPSGQGDLTGYRIEYHAESEGIEDDGTQKAAPSSRLFILFALQEDTVYNITICAVNENGDGPGTSTNVTTKPSNPSSPAGMLRATDVTKTTITVEWTAPPVRERNGRLTGYVLQEVKSRTDDMPLTIPVGVDTVYWTFTGLQPFTEYVVRVAAVNSVGVGPFGEGITIRTLADVPARARIEGVAVLFHSMAILAQDPGVSNGDITGWELSSTVDGQESHQRSSPHSRLMFLRPINAGKVYTLKIRTHNTAGPGEWSEVWEQRATPIIDNVTTSPVGCGVEVCYNVNTPDTPTTLTEFKVHLSPCSNRSVVDMRSFPVTEDKCIQLDHLQTDTCYALWYEGGVRIGLMALPSDTTQTVRVRVDQCQEKPTGNMANRTDTSTTSPMDEAENNEGCSLEKINIDGFYNGAKNIPYFCTPAWTIRRCTMTIPGTGKSCVPTRSKISTIPFRCVSLTPTCGGPTPDISSTPHSSLQIQTVNSSIVYFGLDPDTTYHVEVIPINSVGISGRKHAGKFNFTTLTKLCDLVKTEHPSFHYGQDGRTYLCQAAWNTNKCSLTREGPNGVNCLPKNSKLSNLPFRCKAVRGSGKMKLQMKVPKDLECQLVQADTP